MLSVKLNVYLVAPSPPPYGGISNWTKLIKEYADSREDIAIININIAPKKRSLEGRTLWDRVIIGGVKMIKHYTTLRKKINYEKPDVIHITTSGQLAVFRDIALIRLAKKNGILSVYHIRFGRIPSIAKSKSIEWKLISKAISLASMTIAIDEDTACAIRKHLPSVKVKKIPNPVDMVKLPKALDPIQSTKIVMFLGYVAPSKGINELIAAWQEIHGSFREWALMIIGPYADDYVNELKAKYNTNGISFLGEKSHEHSMELLSKADIFVLPSYTEGFPNAVVEAMALARPIISTEVGAIPEMLSDGCGIIIPPKDVISLREAILDLIKNPNLRNHLGVAAHQKAFNMYSMDKVFEQYMHIWLESKNNL